MKAILEMDETIVNIELIGCLKRFFPTEEEEKLLRNFPFTEISNLGKAEKFFYELLQIPDILLRIDSFLYKLEFKKIILKFNSLISTKK